MSESVLFLAGGISGVAEAFAGCFEIIRLLRKHILIMTFCKVQPFDMVKTRHQLNSKCNAGVLETLRGIYSEGGFRAFYRGMSAELIGSSVIAFSLSYFHLNLRLW